MSRTSELSLNADFSLRGRWWLPQKGSDAIAEELSLSERGIRLVLDGHFDIPQIAEVLVQHH